MMFRRPMDNYDLKKYYPAIFAEGEKETLSEKYLYIPTFKLIEGLQKQGFSVVGAKQMGSRGPNKEFAKHVVYLSHGESSNEATKLLGPGHNFFQNAPEIPLLALTNSHNGLSSFQIDTSFFRLLCSNGLLMPTTSLNSARIVHKVGMQNDVIEASFKVMQSFPEQIAQIAEMKEISLHQDERLALAQVAANIAFDEKEIELNRELKRDIGGKLLSARRREDQKQDLWSTFNIIQENVIKGGIRIVRENEAGKRSYSSTRAVNSIDRDAKLNRELMALAQKMAEIKRGA